MELLIGVLRFSVSESMTISEKMVENQTDVKMKLSRENSVKDNVNDNNNNNNNNSNNNNNGKSNNNSAADANDILPVSQISHFASVGILLEGFVLLALLLLEERDI